MQNPLVKELILIALTLFLVNNPMASAQRSAGENDLRCAIEASKHGAVASLIRSVTPFSMQTPHTGPSRHEEGVKKIPHAALTVEDTKFLQRMQDRGETLELEIYMEAKTHPDSESRNVILQEIANLLLPTIGINVESGWGAPDLTPLRNEGVPVAGLKVDD